MSRATSSFFWFAASLATTSPSFAATYFVGPQGEGQDCTRELPCSIVTGAQVATAGDTVVLLDGVYTEPLNPENSGTADAWITFRADDCSLPIIEGLGESAVENEEGLYPSGVFSNTGTYLRFIGIVSRHWDSGFTNGWTGDKTTNSNGNIEYINCIGDGNHRTAFAMYSATNFRVSECIAAHSGGSPTDSWSSGIQMYAVQGQPGDNVVERSVSFENVDAQNNNDGSGFIVDEETDGAVFFNNIGFGNGGSCFRATRSTNTQIINLSCYHNGRNPNANSPTNPGEFYFTDEESRNTVTLFNVLAAASGSDTDPEVFRFPPEGGFTDNFTIDSGATPFFTDPDGQHPDFRPPAGASPQVEDAGRTAGAPAEDIGFDPRCLIKRDPQVPYQQSWWQYAVDYDYIRSIGGVAQCFHPKARSGAIDIGAYEVSGEAHAFSQPGSCVPGADDPDPGGAGGGAGSGGAGVGGSDAGGGGATSVGGAAAGGDVGVGGVATAGGGAASAGGASAGGAVSAGGSAVGASPSVGGSIDAAAGGSSAAAGGEASGVGASSGEDVTSPGGSATPATANCSAAPWQSTGPAHRGWLVFILGLAWVVVRRRRAVA